MGKYKKIILTIFLVVLIMILDILKTYSSGLRGNDITERLFWSFIKTISIIAAVEIGSSIYKKVFK